MNYWNSLSEILAVTLEVDREDDAGKPRAWGVLDIVVELHIDGLKL